MREAQPILGNRLHSRLSRHQLLVELCMVGYSNDAGRVKSRGERKKEISLNGGFPIQMQRGCLHLHTYRHTLPPN
jgi:hypothetical protein